MPVVNSSGAYRDQSSCSPPPRPRCYVESSPEPPLPSPRRREEHAEEIGAATNAGIGRSTGRIPQARPRPDSAGSQIRTHTSSRAREYVRVPETTYARRLPSYTAHEIRPSWTTSRVSPPPAYPPHPQQGQRCNPTTYVRTMPIPGAAASPQGYIPVRRAVDRRLSDLDPSTARPSKQSGIKLPSVRAQADPVPEARENFTPYALTLRVRCGAPGATTLIIKISMTFERGKLPTIKVRTRRPRRKG